ncbi:chemotaxis protein CheW [Fictibacillus phosphorivorans]|uniref:chemotaxis protein CheW n=1 Tax=Fictibacillus phosphorivorans TaxID=1221500 RepID=UPI00203D30E5|nr:chemotaxis protein CheW [Fictibacillus phosphorivorans]MCM3717137.1 chemotaxis protein CheW [Fictibacillus phosphorivorans]MCM3774824.1 chemotaxis protein CheW [Fictibacillus phosphorivorans]
MLNEQKVIIFQLKEEEYAIPVHEVKSIERMQPITRIPRTNSFIKGVINLRGVVTPIIDLRSRFDIEEAAYTESTRIIIVTAGSIDAGLIVDAANDVMDIDAESIEPPPEVVGGVDAEYLQGVAKIEKRLLILLNLTKVLNPEKITVLQPLESGK